MRKRFIAVSRRGRLLFISLLACALLSAEDWRCPIYPQQKHEMQRKLLQGERAAAAFEASRGIQRSRAASFQPDAGVSRLINQRNNFVDDQIFGKLERDGVAAAPPADDAAFLRRAMLDLTGRIPVPQRVREFLADASPNKRAALVDSLIGSGDFVDSWTKFFANRFEVTSSYYDLIGVEGRNQFHQYLRAFVAADGSYRDFARSLIAAGGDSYQTPAANYLARAIQRGDPPQDTWDVLTNRVTSHFLGVQTQCVSCHDGANHLEPINVYLTARTRAEFLRQSAFLSRLQLIELPADGEWRHTKVLVSDRPTGSYHGLIDPNNPGPRPPRAGAPFSPRYFFNGAEPQSGQWRQELADLVVNDRQFARATVNYLWEHFFRVGIVDPADGWDLARIDPQNPPPAPWTLQASHPELLELLADEFISSGYRIRPIVRLLATSAAYQLSSLYSGEWRPEYGRYFARHTPRRLSAEEIYDAYIAAVGMTSPLEVRGFAEPVVRAMQLPDPSEPWRRYDVMEFLRQFGRGDWWNTPSHTRSSVVQTLFLMNDYTVNFRQYGNRMAVSASRVARMVTAPVERNEAVDELFLAVLGRFPTEQERAAAFAHRSDEYELWLSDLLWALLNRVEFLFNQ